LSNIKELGLEKVFEKGLLLLISAIALTSIVLFILLIYYSATLVISSQEIFLKFQGFS